MKSSCFIKIKILAGMLFFCMAAMAGDYLKSEYSYRRYTTQDGLPNMLLETLHQDKRGFIWIGTYKGFARFDGFSFTHFFTETAMNILHFESFSNGRLKAYTYQEVFVVDINDSVRTIKLVPDSLYLNTFNSRNLPENFLMFENHDASRKYLMQTEGDTVKEILRHPELNRIGDGKPFLDLQNNRFYLPSGERDVHVYDMRTQDIKPIHGLRAETFLKHSSLGLLAFADDGIYRIAGHACEKIADARFSGLKQALEADDGAVFIKDYTGVYRFGNNEIVKYVSAQLTKFWDVLYDNEGNLWIASHDGLYNYFRFDFKNHYLENDVVKTILEDADGNYWLGSYYGCLFQQTSQGITKIDYPTGIHSRQSFIFGSLNAGGLNYFPRDNGVLIAGKTHFSWAELPVENEYCRVLSYKNDQILVLKSTGLYLCNKSGKILDFYSETLLQQDDLHDLAVDNQGRWIVAGSRGLTIINDSIHLAGNSNTSPTLSLCVDNQGYVWSASENRLNLLVNDSITTVHRFSNNFIQAITPVNDTHLLIATLHGIYLMNIRNYFSNGEKEFVFYNHHNGMAALEPMTNSLYMDSKGTLWMPTNEYLVSFNPRKLIRRNTPPTLHILSSETSENNVKWTYTANSDKQRFHHKSRNLRFSFIGLKYSAIENVRYSYRLAGFQDEWSKPSVNRSVTFNNLAPGNYTFEIFADAGTESSQSNVQRITFAVLPAFWQTWWFYTVCFVLSITVIGYLAYRYVSKKNSEKIRALERQKQLNNLQIQSIRLRSIPHFNANVLAGIEYYIMNFSKQEANHYLSMYSSFTNLTLRDVDRPARTLAEEVHYVELYLGLEKMRYGDRFDFSIAMSPEVDKDILLPNMILHTHCENAIKHGLRAKKGKGHIHIAADLLMADEVLVAIEDDGIGRAEAERLQTKGTGQGLAILSQQIELYNQTNDAKLVQRFVDLVDKQAHVCGTRVEIEVPKGFRYEFI